MWKYIINLWIVLAVSLHSSTSFGKIQNILPTSFQVGWDVIKPVYNTWKEKTGPQYEINAILDFKRILIAGDYGWGTILRKNPPLKSRAITENIGQYFRIGLGYNFISNSVDNNVAFLELNYSQAHFKDYIYGILKEDFPFWQGAKNIDTSQQMKVNWLEIVAGVRVKIWEWAYIGCTTRYRFAKHLPNNIYQIPFDIVGWGLNEEDSFGVSYYISIRIPFKNTLLVDTPNTKNSSYI